MAYGGQSIFGTKEGEMEERLRPRFNLDSRYRPNGEAVSLTHGIWCISICEHVATSIMKATAARRRRMDQSMEA